jgi:hypothetical protein
VLKSIQRNVIVQKVNGLSFNLTSDNLCTTGKEVQKL